MRMARLTWRAGFFGAALPAGVCAIVTGAFMATARADVVLSGPTSNAGTYSTAALASLATSSDTVSAGGLTGISLWGLLGGAPASSPTSPIYGDITTSTPPGDNGKNAILRYYVVGGGGGQASVVSAGEINPSFGGTGATPSFVAFQTSGGTLLSQPELIVPGQSARDLSALTSLQLTSVAAQAGVGGGESTTVTLTGPVAGPGSYDLAALMSLTPLTTTTVSGTTYTGTPLFSFINSTDGSITNQIVNTVGTDGYDVAVALAEIDPALGGNPQDILAWASTGTDFPTDGAARTIFPNDNKHGRWESNLYLVQVTDVVPEPGSAGLLIAGLGLCGMIRRRARRQHD
jgi:PEP-CTERM motif